jgi:hypothetical protein
MQDAVAPEPIMRRSLPRVPLWLFAGVIAVAVYLVVAMIFADDRRDYHAIQAPILALGVLACPAGWRRDPVVAFAILIGGIVGATAVAWSAGPVIVMIMAAVAAAGGSLTVSAGYLLGRLVRRVTRRPNNPP